jgi:hypothetical protein
MTASAARISFYSSSLRVVGQAAVDNYAAAERLCGDFRPSVADRESM